MIISITQILSLKYSLDDHDCPNPVNLTVEFDIFNQFWLIVKYFFLKFSFLKTSTLLY